MRLLWVIFLIPISLFGQDTSYHSLTRKFYTMSGKERIKIANRESIEEKSDSVFIRLMSDGDSLFAVGEYILSLEKYRLARKRRPYNINPKVRISDIYPLVMVQESEDKLMLIDSIIITNLVDYTEKTFQEGGFIIIERTTSKGDVYRKSTGIGFYYFENGKSITEREWNSIFNR